ncbi:F0F1 ATP synthase subunit delta [Sutcliffiella rhizosphaerae]|uniref:ATP synthase subunit delta n=1 Tax=Sutcliffiella rhizosphaerae TaxID=2880967 RepID=A0ABN8A4T4_9BACI|nr:F0F1 ATP synthase subunit delta [Sutcliffiella rhizosphaerae]CAG9620139.1 ATP synthase subunit delta [Sutcliffiella rhizosphaerae]
MSKNGVAKRYALALFELAKEHNLYEQFDAELTEVKNVFLNNRELEVILSNPKIRKDSKKQIVREAFASASPYIVNTLQLLIDRHRQGIVLEMIDAYKKLSNEALNVEDAKVYSVRPLTTEEQATLSSVFAAKVGKASLNISNIVDSSIIGGIKIRIGNRIFDGSVSGKLERLGRQLTLNR